MLELTRRYEQNAPAILQSLRHEESDTLEDFADNAYELALQEYPKSEDIMVHTKPRQAANKIKMANIPTASQVERDLVEDYVY